MDTLTERAVRILLFVTGVLTLPAVSPAAAAALVDYQLPLGLLALALLGVAALLLRAGRREARWDNPGQGQRNRRGN